MTKVYYIYHSCFLVELDDRYLLFDYFNKESVSDMVAFSGNLPLLSDEKKLYVFASHGHKDHFDLEVLRWAKDRGDNIHYVLSKHVRLGRNYLIRNGIDPVIKERITFVGARSKYKVDDMDIETLRSTDEGVAFFITVNGMNIYHAGDLHWWNAGGRGDMYSEKYGIDYKREIRTIQNKHIDLAFVVLDPRLGEDGYYFGLEHFLKTVDADYIFPMHLWGQYQWIERFKHRPGIANLVDRIVDIDRECIEYDL